MDPKYLIILCAIIASTVSFAADENEWNAGELWKQSAVRFTEKGSRDFQSDGPMLRSIRVSKYVLAPSETCEMVLARIRAAPIGDSFVFAKEDRFKGWDDWSDDQEAAENCSGFPCKIKFNEPESLAIAAQPKEGRLAEALKQVEGRITEYEKTARRKGYDLPEDPVDPWKVFASKGHLLPAGFDKTKPVFFARKLKFGEGSYRPLRQIFDERTVEKKGQITRLARDVYTAHYFDGWGEWLEARCSASGKEVLLMQDLLMEFDLLKNTDILSRIARPKMRQGVDEESLNYQKTQAGRFFSVKK